MNIPKEIAEFLRNKKNFIPDKTWCFVMYPSKNKKYAFKCRKRKLNGPVLKYSDNHESSQSIIGGFICKRGKVVRKFVPFEDFDLPIEKKVLKVIDDLINNTPRKVNQKMIIGSSDSCDVFKFGEDVAFKQFRLTDSNRHRVTRDVKEEVYVNYHLGKKPKKAKKQHPHIMQIYGMHLKDPCGFVCELCDTSVHNYIRFRLGGGRPIRFNVKIKILFQTCLGMEFMHSQYIIHRDLKWKNVLLNFTNPIKVKISDFGLSKFQESFKVNTFCGTTGKGRILIYFSEYIAPECVSNRQVSFPLDVYSFGMMMFELLFDKIDDLLNIGSKKVGNGASDFMGSRLIFTIHDNILRPKIPKDHFVCRNHRWLVNLMKRCWEVNPAKRPTFSEITSLFRSKFGGILKTSSTQNKNEFDYKKGFLDLKKENEELKLRLLKMQRKEIKRKEVNSPPLKEKQVVSPKKKSPKRKKRSRDQTPSTKRKKSNVKRLSKFFSQPIGVKTKKQQDDKFIKKVKKDRPKSMFVGKIDRNKLIKEINANKNVSLDEEKEELVKRITSLIEENRGKGNKVLIRNLLRFFREKYKDWDRQKFGNMSGFIKNSGKFDFERNAPGKHTVGLLYEIV